MIKPRTRIFYIPETGEVFRIHNRVGDGKLEFEQMPYVGHVSGRDAIVFIMSLLRAHYPNWSIQVWGYKCKVEFSTLRELAIIYDLRRVLYRVFWPSARYRPERRVKILQDIPLINPFGFGAFRYSPGSYQRELGNPDYL